MRISDWSSDVCSSDLKRPLLREIRSIAKRIPRDVEMADVMALRLEQLGIWAVGCMFQQRPRKQQQVKPADQRHDKTHGRDLENADRRLARGAGPVVNQQVGGCADQTATYAKHRQTAERRVGKECVRTCICGWSQYK